MSSVGDILAIQEARIAYDTARRRHERQSFELMQKGRPMAAYRERAAAKRLAYYGASELVVIGKIG